MFHMSSFHSSLNVASEKRSASHVRRLPRSPTQMPVLGLTNREFLRRTAGTNPRSS
jgi:hypothetical protein